MAGIILLSVLLIAFVVYCVLIYLPIRWAKKRGIAERKRFYIGVASFIVVSALFFGKNLISYTAFKYYCKNEAGLTVYKTLDQWQAENPGVWETLKQVRDTNDYKNRRIYPNVALKKDFNGESFYVSGGGNQRVIFYTKTSYLFWDAVAIRKYIIYDMKSSNLLFSYNNYIWKNTWGTTRNKHGGRHGLISTRLACKKPQSYNDFWSILESFSNQNLTTEKENE